MKPTVVPFIFASGYGTRLRPLTHNIPKPLIPVQGDKTIIDFIVEELVRNRFKSAYVNYSYGKEYFFELKKRHSKMIDLVLVDDRHVCGQGGILIKELTALSAYDQILCLNGDTIIEFDLDSFIAKAGALEIRLLTDNSLPVLHNLLCTKEGAVVARGAAPDANNIEWYRPTTQPLTVHNYLGVALLPTASLRSVTFAGDYMGFFGPGELIDQLIQQKCKVKIVSSNVDLFLTANTVEELTALQAALQ